MPRRPARRRKFRFTPARRAALDEARKKRKFQMTPAKRAAVRKAAEANRRDFRMTRARRRAMSINVRKMQRASVEKFRLTEARLAACRANIQKALAVERAPESYARSRFNHLQHGLQVRTLEETIPLLGEDPKEYEAHKRRFRRVFAPRFQAEEKVVDLIAAAVWRRLRLFKAQARWESDALKQFFAKAAFIQPLGADETRVRGHFLLALLLDRDKLEAREQSLLAVVEREIRTLLRLRSGGDPDFRFISRDSEKTWRQYEKLLDAMEAEYREIAEEENRNDLLERLMEGGPDVEAALRKVRSK
jgi:hypothetical protein